MKNQHTPGPWRAAATFEENQATYYGVYGPRVLKQFNGPLIGRFDSEADAHLAAEAPAMLEALRELAADRYLSDPINADLMARVNAILSRLT